ncbi:MAG: hypothetical protein NPIRA03_25710 [Nitrospirales bacterium]|nr:MAG: hypothetical protein NPIRA03_25710 [Nitrospirales bacterium]
MSKALAVKRRQPPAKPQQSEQLSMFRNFYGDSKDLSNTIEMWDAIPKYAVAGRIQASMRDEKGNLPLYEQEFVYSPTYAPRPESLDCKVVIQPVKIKNKDGSSTDYYPSADEELVEEVLKKIFSDQTFGDLAEHDPAQKKSKVWFSLSMVQRELKDRGRTRSLDEIKTSIEILAKTVLEVGLLKDRSRRGLLYTGTILQDLTRLTREDYLIDPKQLWCARLPEPISDSINNISYRQFNYGTLMDLKSPLARWFHKRLSHNYTQANHVNRYSILQTTIERDSGLVRHSRKDRRIAYVEDVLQELIDAKVLEGFDPEKEPAPRGKGIINVKYHLQPSFEFVQEMKNANARNRDSQNGTTKLL